MNLKENLTGLEHVGIPTADLDKTIAFYESLGFRAVTEPYDLTGILHIDMQWKAE